MLKSLKFDVTFPNGKRFQQDITFEKGHTSITGLNGKGKSLIPEMLQYAYWGATALRGMADDYKKLSVYHEFELRGQAYSVDRRGSTVILCQGQTPIATGTKPVNAKMRELFGYSYDVFQVANACNQGKVMQLGEMGATDRKKLVDQTIGLDSLDELIKFITKEETSLRGTIKGIEETLKEPVAPVVPDNFRQPEEIKAELLGLQKLQAEHTTLKARASRTVTAPIVPTAPDDVSKLEEYKDIERKRDVLTAERNAIVAQIQGIPDAKMTLEEIEKHEKHINDYNHWVGQDALRKSLLTKRVEHNCPACKHQWHDQDPRLAELEGLVPVEVPTQTLVELKKQRDALARADIKKQGGERLIKVMGELDALPPSLGSKIAAINVYLNAFSAYNQACARFDSDVEEIRVAAEALCDSKFKALDAMQGLSDLLLACSVYVSQFNSYEANLKTYHEGLEKVIGLKKEADEWGAAKKAVADLRTRVKAYLLPSLNKVASSLINAMTGGELSWVIVNDNFDITVEGQRLETLSGAGKAVANLAIRIALGQVLTNKVFSVMMLDEVDADCDAQRAKFVAECVRRLTNQIGQVVQVSHKQIEADHYVRL